MKRKGRALQQPYRTALLGYLERGSRASVGSARKLGRQAVALGMETLDLVQIHEDAMALAIKALPMDSGAARDSVVKRARKFFAEALLPLEETHRTARAAHTRLSALGKALKQRTRDLSASNRKLKGQVARCKAVEETLRKSEQHTNGLLKQSRHQQEQLRYLSRRVLSAQEEERKRVSRELHDIVAQMLTGINVRLTTLKTETVANSRDLSRNIERTQRLVEKSVNVVHRFARELRPAMLDDLGLVPAVHAFLQGFTKETGIRASFTAFEGSSRLSVAKRTALYRVAQEALTNVARHSQANRVEVILQRLPGAVRMQIKDNGKSFDVDRMWRGRHSRHLGMLGMRERMEMVRGSFAVESVPGCGTRIQVQVPLKKDAREDESR